MITRVSPSVRTNDSQPVDLFPTLDLSSLISRGRQISRFSTRESLSLLRDAISPEESVKRCLQQPSLDRSVVALNVDAFLGCFIACWPSTIIPSIYLSGFTPLCISFCLFLPFVHLSVRLAFNLYKRAVSAELVPAADAEASLEIAVPRSCGY